MQPTSAVYSGGSIFVPAQNEADSLYNDGYGSHLRPQILTLEPYEALYLLEKEKIAIVDEDTQIRISFQELLARCIERDKLTWSRYIIFRDLRSRGFVAKPERRGGKNLSVYERGTYGKKPPAWRVYTVSEGVPETAGHLALVRREAEDEGTKLKLAVVDRRGEIVYYGLGELDLSELGSEESE